MIAGKILLTNFAMEAEVVKLTGSDGEEREMIAMIAFLFNAGNENPVATITIPMADENLISLLVQMASLLTPEQHVDLLAKLSTKGSGILLAKPGDERKVAENLKPGAVQ